MASKLSPEELQALLALAIGDGTVVGWVALFHGVSAISFLIRWETRSKYSHAAFLLPDGKTIIESVEGVGVHARQVEASDAGNMELFNVQGMTPEQWKAAITFAIEQIGDGYDLLDDLRFITHQQAHANQASWFCSELVYYSLQQGGINMLRDVDAAEVSPELLNQSPLLIPCL